MFEGEKRCGYEVWDYVIMGNHYHALIYIPKAESMSQAKVLRRSSGFLMSFKGCSISAG
jgi:REP element-mobilizing transposase RayT